MRSKYIFTSRFRMFYFPYSGGEVGLMGGVVAGGWPDGVADESGTGFRWGVVRCSAVVWYGLPLGSGTDCLWNRPGLRPVSS